MESLGQYVIEEAADKRVDGQCHGFVAVWSLDAIILPFESDASFICFDQSPIGDGNAPLSVALQRLPGREWV